MTAVGPQSYTKNAGNDVQSELQAKVQKYLDSPYLGLSLAALDLLGPSFKTIASAHHRSSNKDDSGEAASYYRVPTDDELAMIAESMGPGGRFDIAMGMDGFPKASKSSLYQDDEKESPGTDEFPHIDFERYLPELPESTMFAGNCVVTKHESAFKKKTVDVRHCETLSLIYFGMDTHFDGPENSTRVSMIIGDTFGNSIFWDHFREYKYHIKFEHWLAALVGSYDKIQPLLKQETDAALRDYAKRNHEIYIEGLRKADMLFKWALNYFMFKLVGLSTRLFYAGNESHAVQVLKEHAEQGYIYFNNKYGKLLSIRGKTAVSAVGVCAWNVLLPASRMYGGDQLTDGGPVRAVVYVDMNGITSKPPFVQAETRDVDPTDIEDCYKEQLKTLELNQLIEKSDVDVRPTWFLCGTPIPVVVQYHA